MKNTRDNLYCFTVDDNFRFFAESTKWQLSSVFDHPYMAFFKQMHEKYNCKIQFNTFFRYDSESISLSEVSEKWHDELSESSDWLRFSFHSKSNRPTYPYRNAVPEEISKDISETMRELERIAGNSASSLTTTIHYVSANKASCMALKQTGVDGLIGMFYESPDSESLSYYLSDAHIRQMNSYPLRYDLETGLSFLRNKMILNKETTDSVISKLEIATENILQIMIHEQYFYRDYSGYQEDFREKVESTLDWLSTHAYDSVLFEELLCSKYVLPFSDDE